MVTTKEQVAPVLYVKVAFYLWVETFYWLSMASCNFLIWNVRGLNDKKRRDMVHQVVQSCQPVVVCIEETKLSHISHRDVLTILGQNFKPFTYLPAQSSRGGILVAWRDDALTVEAYRVQGIR